MPLNALVTSFTSNKQQSEAEQENLLTFDLHNRCWRTVLDGNIRSLPSPRLSTSDNEHRLAIGLSN